jgi:hypothetical protein
MTLIFKTGFADRKVMKEWGKNNNWSALQLRKAQKFATIYTSLFKETHELSPSYNHCYCEPIGYPNSSSRWVRMR